MSLQHWVTRCTVQQNSLRWHLKYSVTTKIKIISKWFSKDLMKRQNISSAESPVFSLGWWEWCNCNIFDCSWSISAGAEPVCPGVQCDEATGVCRDLRHQGPQHGVHGTQVHTRRRWDDRHSRVVLCSSIQWLITWYSPLRAWCSVAWTLS